MFEEQPDVRGQRRLVPASAPHAPSGVRIDKLGIEMTDITPNLARQYGFEQSTIGVVITRFATGSLAAGAALRSGTMATKIDTTPVRSMAEADVALQKTAPEQGVLLQVQFPDGASGYVLIKSTTGR